MDALNSWLGALRRRDRSDAAGAGAALHRLFAGKRGVERLTLDGGRTLFAAGDPADHLYLLTAGRLGVYTAEPGQPPRLLGVIRPGEPAGEMALIADAPHASTVTALRDSELLAIPRTRFLAAARTDAALMSHMAALVVRRLRVKQPTPASEAKVFGLVATPGAAPVRPLAEALSAQLTRLGLRATCMGAEARDAPPGWFGRVEEQHDAVLYAVEADEDRWREVVRRQTDRLFLVADADAPPAAASEVEARPAPTLLLRRRSGGPRHGHAWRTAVGAGAVLHLLDGSEGDLRRLAREVSGRSVGLVLSGGGARAYAHVGVVKALRAAGVAIDSVGGASMGAMVAAGVALGWEDEELDHRMRAAFVQSSPLDDMAPPIVALTAGRKVDRRLQEHFGEVEIADLPLPFFCVSSDLTAGAVKTHRAGLLRQALRASIALPGVLPPVVEDGEVLVDGAVLRNFPADIMRAAHAGPLIGSDVTRARALQPEEVAAPASLWRWLGSGAWRNGPPIVSILMRAATVTSFRDIEAARAACDLLVIPEVAHIELRDWGAYDPAVAAGELAARLALGRVREDLRLEGGGAAAAPAPAAVTDPA